MSDPQQDKYRECFQTPAGKVVLGHLLIDAGFFDTNLKTLEEIAVENYAKKILKNLGVWDSKSVSAFVGKLFELPVI